MVIVTKLTGPDLDAVRLACPGARLVFVNPEHPEATHLQSLERLQGPVFADEAGMDLVCAVSKRTIEPLDALVAPSSPPGRVTPAPRRREEPRRAGPVVFCPSNDTHVRMFVAIAGLIPGARFLVADHRVEERARETLAAQGTEFIAGDAGTLARMWPSAVVVGNDWYDIAHDLFRAVRPRGIPTVCVQEGCLDFSQERRMQYCDYPVIQGLIVLEHLHQRLYLPTGNPRFDGLAPLPLPSSPLVMINSNFTYGIQEESREAWVRGVANACVTLGVPYFVSKHPRDRGTFPDLPVRASGAGVVHSHVRDATVVVTRFSTVVYEALHLGRQVIYHNPHGERMRLFNEDETGALFLTRDASTLVEALQAALNPPSPARRDAIDLFLDLHCGPRDGLAAQRCAESIAAIAARGDVASRPTARQRLHAWSMFVR